MGSNIARSRGPRHYLSYVREDLIGLWKAQAVSESAASGRNRNAQNARWNLRALEKRKALLGGQAETVWPWAFQLGGTPAARSLRKGDTLWIVTRPTGLDREWPPTLVARMTLAENAHLGPADRQARKNLPFPFHFGVTMFAKPDDGHFLPANDATIPLLETGFASPLKNRPVPDEIPATREDHSRAWAAMARSGFQSLRRIDDATALQAFFKRLLGHSVFVSYRWLDHEPGTAEFEHLCEVTEDLMIGGKMGVWLDRLTLPFSKHDSEERRKVIEKLLASPVRDTTVLLARITRNYAGLSSSGNKKERYTLLEWQQAPQIVRWNREPCENEEHLLKTGKTPLATFSRDERNAGVAEKLEQLF